MQVAFLVIGSAMLTLSTSTTVSSHDRAAYAHTFSQNENVLFLTIVHQIESQIQITESNIPTNFKLYQQHANNAIGL